MCAPVTGETIAALTSMTAAETGRAIETADAAFRIWRTVPAPKRGELVRLFGEEPRAAQDALDAMVSVEAGKQIIFFDRAELPLNRVF